MHFRRSAAPVAGNTVATMCANPRSPGGWQNTFVEVEIGLPLALRPAFEQNLQRARGRYLRPINGYAMMPFRTA
jgi:hypothetical protein